MQLVPNIDPNRVVKATVYSAVGVRLGGGTNRFAYGTQSTAERWADKYHWVLHAEEDAIHTAYQSSNASLSGGSIETDYFPCARCANHIVRAGLKRVHAPVPDLTHHRWGKDWQIALDIFKENGVHVVT